MNYIYSETCCSPCNCPMGSGLLNRSGTMCENSRKFKKRTNGGLPQGTKLVPLLFAILVNYLLKNWQGRIKFVDDTTTFDIIPRGSPSILPIVVDEISNFASRRGMQLNPKKCKEMIISFLKYNLFYTDLYLGSTC